MKFPTSAAPISLALAAAMIFETGAASAASFTPAPRSAVAATTAPLDTVQFIPRRPAPYYFGPRVGPGPRYFAPRGYVGRPYWFSRPWIGRPYYGTIVAGVALGALITVAAIGYAPRRPAPNLCWYWADPRGERGYWDYCS